MGLGTLSQPVIESANETQHDEEIVVPHAARKPLMAVVGRFLGVLSAFLVNAVIARLLPEGVFSDFQLLLSLLTPASWIAVWGLNSSAVRLIGEETAKQGTSAAVSLAKQMLRQAATTAIISMPLWWLLLYIGTHYLGFPLPGDALLLVVFVATVAMIGFQQVIADCFFGHHDVGTAPLFTGGLMAGPITTLLFLSLFLAWCYGSAQPTEASNYVLHIASITIAFRKPALIEAICALLISLCISLPIAEFALRRLHNTLAAGLPTNVSASQQSFHLARIGKVGIAMLGMSISAYILTVLVDVWIAGKLFRDANGHALLDLDWYIAARRLTFMAFITLQLAGSLAAPSAALFYFSAKQTELQKTMRRYAWYGGLPSIVAVLIMIAVPQWMLTVYLGERFGGAATVVRILAIAPLFAAWAGHGGYALSVTGHQNYALVVNLVASLFVIVAGFPAAYYWQLNGLAVVSVLGFVIKHGCEWILARRLLGVWCHVY